MHDSYKGYHMIGLYYPYIHFRDGNWLKFALIYWSKIARIVPSTFSTHDSDDVKRVKNELGAVIDAPPHSAGNQVAEDFMAFVKSHAKQLRQKYDTSKSSTWKINKYTQARAPAGTDPRFGYIFHEKLGDDLKDALTSERLGAIGEAGDMRWIGVHPDIAGVYMTSMAESIAEYRGYKLLADETVRHVVVGDRNVDRLAALLLGERFEPLPNEFLSPHTIAVVALRTVIPRDLSTVPMASIVQFRKQYSHELADFQSWIHASAQKLATATGGITSPSALNDHLTVLEEQEIKPRLKELKKQLKSVAIETTASALSFKSPVLLGAAATAYFLSMPAIAVASAAVGLIPMVAKAQRDAQKLVSGNFAAYLMHAEERCSPRGIVKKVRSASRKALLDV